MLDIAPADSVPPSEVLASSGGFAWWYCDVLDASGSGVVLIWSFGLPFLPGVLDSARRGQGERPDRRPSLAISLFEHGKPVGYLLREYEPEDVHWDGQHTWRWGDCHFERSDKGSRTRLFATLDCEVPGLDDRLRGTVSVEGPARNSDSHEPMPDPSKHVWAPAVGPSQGVVRITMGSVDLTVIGSGYLDRNHSTLPLDQLGFRRWTWGRSVIGDTLWIWYILWDDDAAEPTCHLVCIDSEGRTEVLPEPTVDVEWGSIGLWGLPGIDALHIAAGGRPLLTVRRRQVLDEGPFYRRARMHVRHDDGLESWAIGELCEPGRIDRWHQPLVRMSVHRPPVSSIWLPLFSGPVRGRFPRLLMSLLASVLAPVRRLGVAP